MRVRILFILGMLAIFAGAGVAGAQAASRYNAAPIYVQEQSNWCWAATSKTVIAFYTSNRPSQCTLVKQGKGTSTCGNVTGSFYGDVTNDLLYGGLRNLGTATVGTISYARLQDEINISRVVMIRWGWTSGGGHMLVLRGYNTTNSSVSYVNPLLSSYQSGSYSYMVSASDHTWTHSRYDLY